jgi:Leucine-rich repeat (LRR) protein
MNKVGYYLVLAFIFFGCSNNAEQVGEEIEGNSDDTVNIVDKVAIPDANFERALVNLNFDDVVDGEVEKNRIDLVTELIINDNDISDLSGISAFSALENLNVRDNQLTSLDVSNNSSLLFVWAEGNQLGTVNVNGLSSLEKLGLERNNISQISVSTNTALQLLTLAENRLESIDVSSNTALTDFTVSDNPLSCILVNQTQLSAIPTDWSKDEADSYSLDCE